MRFSDWHGFLDGNTVDGLEILHQLRLVVYPIVYQVLYIPQVVVWDFLPPAVSYRMSRYR